MALDLYSPCPCGSGKKFKWCCQPIHTEIDRAIQQDEEGQHEAALRIMDEVTRAHPSNPEAWGRKAEMLFRNDKAAEAETALEKAFELNPNYPFGHLLRGHFRFYEGEMPGALLMFRKAAELFDPEAKAILAQVYFNIFECEMRLNRPVAARLAVERARNLAPTSQELRAGLDSVFGTDNPNLPTAAKKEYRYRSVPASAGPERRQAWDRALGKASGKLSDAAQAFETLVREDENDAAAWYNLGLTHAWRGDNHAAVDALERYVALEGDEQQAAEAWALVQVLLCGQGMEERADLAEHSVVAPLADPQAFVQFLGQLEGQGLLFGTRVDQEHGVLSALLLEKPAPALTAELEAKQAPRFAAHLVLMGNVLRLWSTSRERVEQQFKAMREKIGQGMGEAHWVRGPVKFQDILVEHFIFPRVGDKDAANAMLLGHLEKEFEEVWIHRPIRSLGNVPPLDAVGHGTLRKKLRGIILFLEECGKMIKLPYDMERLRRKLGLSDGANAGPADKPMDIAAMSVAELAGLDVKTLAPGQLEDAFQAAIKLDAREVAGQYARELVARPSRPERPDRYPWFNHLVQLALARGDSGAAIDHLNEGERDDCENNGGRRRNDYELRRGQVHVKAGQVTEAKDVFDRLIARSPDELKLRVGAAEALLSAKQGKQALAIAEAGLAEARKQNNRDLEGHFLELAEAAKRS